jgi:hypothetical protein
MKMDEVIARLIKEKENLCLVVGRSTEITNRIDGCLVATCDIASSISPRHLQLDFNNVDALKMIPDNLFTIIIIDWSTMRYLLLSKRAVAEQISRITKKFIFESSVSSIKVGDEAGYEFDNPSHTTITRERYDAIVSAKSKSSPLLRSLGLSSRLVIPAERAPSGSDSRMIYNGMIRENDLLFEIEKQFRDCLVGEGLFASMQVCHAPYPLETNGYIRRYLSFERRKG